MKALELILQLAEGSTTPNTLQHIAKIARETIEALKAQPQQEPVAFEIRAFNATQALIKRADVAQEKADVLERGFGSEADVTIVPLYTSPQAQQEPSLAAAWQQGYDQGVADERTSEANIGVAGFGAKVTPARNNPYSAGQQEPLTPEWYAQWIRNNYQDHWNIATLCDEMTKAAHGIKGDA